MKSAVHHSHETDSFLAGQGAIREVLKKMAGYKPDLLLLFSSIGHDLPKLISGIESLSERVPLCGCTGAGIITGGGSDEATHSIALMALSSECLNIVPFIYSDLANNPEKIGMKIAARVCDENIPNDKNSLLFLFADGLTINADAVYRGMRDVLPGHIDVVGGTAGNDFQLGKTYQFYNSMVVNDSVCGMLLYGDFNYRIEVTHGSKPVGMFRTITRATGNVIREIDGQPALDILKDFIGAERVQDVGQTLNLFELGEEFPGQGYSENILNRAIIGVDEVLGGIRLAVEIPEGAKVRITRRDMSLVLQRTREMAEAMTRGLQESASATYFYFNCSGRGSYLFGDPEQDVDALRDVLAPDSTIIGFFTFGEFAPINNRNYFHNYTGVLVGLEA
jgi:hypothetical protein